MLALDSNVGEIKAMEFTPSILNVGNVGNLGNVGNVEASVIPERPHGIDPSRASRRHGGCEHGDSGQEQRHRSI